MTTATARGKPASSPAPSASAFRPKPSAKPITAVKPVRRARAKPFARRRLPTSKALPVQHPHAAGIDVGSRSHWVCVGFTTEAPSCLIQEFPAHTDGLKAIAAFLREHQVNTIALESTGIYWVPLYELLQAEGFEVLLVDPSYSHQLRGRPKTDRRDCQWIYRLHSVGLLAAAFRPDEQTCRLRALPAAAGQPDPLCQPARAAHAEGAGADEPEADGNPQRHYGRHRAGHSSGRSCVGHEAPEKLAKYRDKQCKASEAEIAQALTGSYREEHLFELKLAYEAWQFTLGQVAKVDGQIALQLGRMKCDRALPPLKPKARRNAGSTRPISTFGQRCTTWWGWT